MEKKQFKASKQAVKLAVGKAIFLYTEDTRKINLSRPTVSPNRPIRKRMISEMSDQLNDKFEKKKKWNHTNYTTHRMLMHKMQISCVEMQIEGNLSEWNVFE